MSHPLYFYDFIDLFPVPDYTALPHVGAARLRRARLLADARTALTCGAALGRAPVAARRHAVQQPEALPQLQPDVKLKLDPKILEPLECHFQLCCALFSTAAHSLAFECIFTFVGPR